MRSILQGRAEGLNGRAEYFTREGGGIKRECGVFYKGGQVHHMDGTLPGRGGPPLHPCQCVNLIKRESPPRCSFLASYSLELLFITPLWHPERSKVSRVQSILNITGAAVSLTAVALHTWRARGPRRLCSMRARSLCFTRDPLQCAASCGPGGPYVYTGRVAF